jgi:tetratricopeptide (TPR) repeat protein
MRNVATALCLAAGLLAACNSGSKRSMDETPTPEDAAPAPSTGTFTADGAGQGQLGEEFQRLTLKEQKAAVLVEQHIAKAIDLRERLQLEQAEREVALALDVDPDNLEAKQLMAEIGALLGRPAGQIQSTGDALATEYGLRTQQLFEEAKSNYRAAKVMLARGNYEGAIAELTLCLDHIRWSPYAIDWQGLEEEASALLDSTKQELAASIAANREESQRQAREELKDRERSARSRREAIVANMLDQAINAFEAERYDEAGDFAEKALDEDPRNERAADIRDASFRAGRRKVKADFLDRKREQYARWQETLYELRIPYDDVITLPDEDYWQAITEMRARRQGIDLSETVTQSEIELRNRVATLRIPGLVVEEDESLMSVVGTLRTISELPLVVDPLAEEAAIDEGVVFDLPLRNSLTVEKALNLITDMAGENVTWTIRHDAVLVTTKEKARGELVIYNHDIQDLIFGLTDFLGPRIDELRLLDDLEDDDGGGPFGGIGERPTIIEADELATLVQENVAVGSWEEDGIAITVEAGNMIVVHTPAVQKQVRQFLEDLRRFSASLVTIESKFMTITDNFLQEIGVEFRGLENPGSPFTDLDDITNGLEDNASLGLDNSGTGNDNGNAAGPPSAGFFYDDGGDGDIKGSTSNIFESPLGDALTNIGGLTAQYTFLNDLQVSMILRLVEKSSNVELINDQVLSVHNTQRAFVTVVNQRAYIQDFDVEVAQFEAVADPQINILNEGIVLDVRPTIHHNRRYLTLEIQPTVAKVISLTDFSTTLSGATAPVTFQLPELNVQSVFTTVVVPDGGSILLGGLSRVRNIERRAEVPWIANVPIVGFFFKEEGYSNEKESLMIMLRAWISDVKEELSGLEATR